VEGVKVRREVETEVSTGSLNSAFTYIKILVEEEVSGPEAVDEIAVKKQPAEVSAVVDPVEFVYNHFVVLELIS
jgi:cation transport regulator ChaC